MIQPIVQINLIWHLWPGVRNESATLTTPEQGSEQLQLTTGLGGSRLFHALAIFFTAIWVLVAIVQVSGRLSLAFADRIAPRINERLEPYDSQISGVAADWRGFNPVLRAEQIVFPAGHLRNVYLEVDFLQTIANGSLVFRRLYSEDGAIAFVHTPAGWQLKNRLDQSLDIDFLRLFELSEFIDASVQLLAERDGLEVAYGVKLSLSNVAQNLQGSLTVVSPAAEETPNQLSVNFYPSESPQQTEGQRINAVQASGALTLPPALLGGTGLTLTLPLGQWQASPASSNSASAGSSGVGGLKVALQVTQAPWVRDEQMPRVDAEVFLWQDPDPERVLARIDTRLTTADNPSLQLPPLFAELNLGRLTQKSSVEQLLVQQAPILRVRVEELELGALTDFANQTFNTDAEIAQWIRGFDTRADVREIVAQVSAASELSFWAQTEAVNMAAYRGSPKLVDGSAEVFGDMAHLGITVADNNLTMQFPELFTAAWPLREVQGELMLLFRPGYASVRGVNIEARSGQTRLRGSFATSRPEARPEQRLTLALQADVISAPNARPFIPYKLSDGLRQWLLQAPLAGDFSSVRLAQHGQIHVLGGDTTRRRFELMADFESAQVRYDPAWPTLDRASGSVHVAGRHTYAVLDDGLTSGFAVAGANLHVDANAQMLSLKLQKSAPGASALGLVLGSPLHQSLSFVTPEWQAQGDIAFNASIAVPLGELGQSQSKLQVELDTSFEELHLSMPNYRLYWEGLFGQQRFSLPHNLEGQLGGRLFEQPVAVAVTHDARHLRFQVDGSIAAKDIFPLAQIAPIDVLSGYTDFTANLQLTMDNSAAPHLNVASGLVGMSVELPAQFGKAPDVLVDSNLEVLFAEDHQRISWQYQGSDGWFVLPDEGSLRVAQGAVAINDQPLVPEVGFNGLVVSGYLPQADLADWVSDAGDVAISLPMDWQIRGLQIDDFVVKGLHFADLQLDGQSNSDGVIFQLRSPDVVGSIDLSDDSQLGIDLLSLRLPVSTADEEENAAAVDPIDISVGRALPAAKVFLNELVIGNEPFGRWKFTMTPEQAGVRFDIDDVLVNGLSIQDSAVFWDLQQNRSAFSGTARTDDLATTLPLWGYAPAVMSETAQATGNLSWAGSPGNIDIIDSEGELSLAATEGRFLDIDSAQGGLRAVSLLNITALAKRISLDFSDVVGGGISFEKVRGDVQIEDQTLSFTRNLIIKSTSSRFELGGLVDLRSGELDAQMIVTLPVSDSLPWYAAYLTFVNPLAGLGVALGERVFRKPIERMSSAKFEVSGPLDDPEVVFSELFNKDIEETDSAGERLSPDLLEAPASQTEDGAGGP